MVRFVYFGGEPIGVPVLEALIEAGYVPALVVTNPDRPAGRGLTLTPPPVKALAQTHHIPVWQPTDFSDETTLRECLQDYELFVVVAYNKILPKWLIELPPHKTINVHPSLLPKLRGASPIRSAIRNNERDAIGVTIMLMDEAMDHGPILAQEAITIPDEAWPIGGHELDALLARRGGALLSTSLPQYLSGALSPKAQSHDEATYCTRLKKEDGKVLLDPHNLPTGEAAQSMLHTIRAFEGYPGTYFIYNDMRVKILDATIENNTLLPLTVVPEGKKPQPFSTWRANLGV